MIRKIFAKRMTFDQFVPKSVRISGEMYYSREYITQKKVREVEDNLVMLLLRNIREAIFLSAVVLLSREGTSLELSLVQKAQRQYSRSNYATHGKRKSNSSFRNYHRDHRLNPEETN